MSLKIVFFMKLVKNFVSIFKINNISSMNFEGVIYK